MNIKEAKTQIKNAIKAYFTKDEFGNYQIPIERQRPVFLMGPPGIGKTAIMEQIASDLGVEVKQDGNLDYLAKQGVLLLNTILTVEHGKALAHKSFGWEKFTDNVIKYINTFDNTNIIAINIITPLNICIERRAGQISENVMKEIYSRYCPISESEVSNIINVIYE